MPDQAAIIAELSQRLDRLEARSQQLESENRQLRSENAQLRRENDQLRERVVVMEHRMRAMARRQFGRSSETIPERGQQELDLGGVISPTLTELTEQPGDDDDPPPGGGGGQRNRRTGRKRGGRMQLPEHLPVEERSLDLPPERRRDAEGRSLRILEWRTTDKLDYLPGYCRILRFRIPVYGHPWEPDAQRRSPSVPGIVTRGLPSDDLVAHVVTAKYADHLPHYRQEDQFRRQGIQISRATLGNWTATAAEALRPVHEAIGAAVLRQSHLHLDDTTIRVLQPGAGRTHTGRVWVYSHGPDVFYDYTPTRAGRWCVERLRGFQGHVICDDYAGHNQLFKLGEAIEANCWAHARRKFFDCGDTRDAPAILEIIGRLYAVEKDIADRPPDERRRIRQEQSTPILDHLHQILLNLERDTTPRSGIGLAVRYCLRLWTGLTAFVDEGNLPIDNNDAERAMRRVAMARKNSLFSGSNAHAEQSAICFSIIESCRRAGLNPQAYLVDTFAAIQAGQTDFDALRPAAVARTRHAGVA